MKHRILALGLFALVFFTLSTLPVSAHTTTGSGPGWTTSPYGHYYTTNSTVLNIW